MHITVLGQAEPKKRQWRELVSRKYLVPSVNYGRKLTLSQITPLPFSMIQQLHRLAAVFDPPPSLPHCLISPHTAPTPVRMRRWQCCNTTTDALHEHHHYILTTLLTNANVIVTKENTLKRLTAALSPQLSWLSMILQSLGSSFGDFDIWKGSLYTFHPTFLQQRVFAAMVCTEYSLFLVFLMWTFLNNIYGKKCVANAYNSIRMSSSWANKSPWLEVQVWWHTSGIFARFPVLGANVGGRGFGLSWVSGRAWL